jgi:hypothetical protein
MTISTALPDHGVVFRLTSTFVGHKGVDTQMRVSKYLVPRSFPVGPF